MNYYFGRVFLIEIRWHGRGGHGIVVASQLLGEMLLKEGLYSLSRPLFGAERRGAPVMVVTRIDNKPILTRSTETNPDIIVVTDKRLVKMVDVTKGLKNNGLVVINTDKFDEELKKVFSGYCVAYLNAVEISERVDLKVGGIPLVNIPLLGALVKATNLVKRDTAIEVLYSHWGSGEIGRKNVDAFTTAYEVVKIVGSA